MITVQKLDFSKTYALEQKINMNDPSDLPKHGMSKYPGSATILTASYNPTVRKFKTGLDINAQEILEIKDPEEKKKAVELITELKTELEAYYGTPGLLDPASAFWDNFGVPITVGKNNQTFIDLGGLSKVLNPVSTPLETPVS